MIANGTTFIHIHLPGEALEVFLDIFHTLVAKFAALDEVTLVALAALATDEEYAVHAPGESVRDPDPVDGTKTTDRNKPCAI